MNCLSFNPYSEYILATGSADKVRRYGLAKKLENSVVFFSKDGCIVGSAEFEAEAAFVRIAQGRNLPGPMVAP